MMQGKGELMYVFQFLLNTLILLVVIFIKIEYFST